MSLRAIAVEAGISHETVRQGLRHVGPLAATVRDGLSNTPSEDLLY
jgi:hypothetical protein